MAAQLGPTYETGGGATNFIRGLQDQLVYMATGFVTYGNNIVYGKGINKVAHQFEMLV